MRSEEMDALKRTPAEQAMPGWSSRVAGTVPTEQVVAVAQNTEVKEFFTS